MIDVGFLFHYLSHIPPQWAALNLFASWWLEWVHYPVTSFTEVFSPKVLERQHFYMFTSSIKSPKWTEGNHTSAHFMLLIEKATQSGTNLELNVQTVSFLSLWRFHRHWSKVQGELRKTGQTWPNYFFLFTPHVVILENLLCENHSFLRQHLFVYICLR